MMGNKESELTAAVLQYALRCLVEGDRAALRSMNFGPREVEALRKMNLGDLCHIESLRTPCLKVALDREMYWHMMAYVRNRRESGDLQKALIIADASQEMMQTFFGTGAREYVRLRRMLMMDTTNGRPPEPNEEQTQRLWDAWKRRTEGRENPSLPAKEYLAIHEETGVPLRAVWSQTSRWTQYGKLPSTANSN